MQVELTREEVSLLLKILKEQVRIFLVETLIEKLTRSTAVQEAAERGW